MGRPKRIYQSEFPYHIYNRTNNSEFLFNLEEAYPVFMRCLKYVSCKMNLRVHHFVLMSNHYHLIASTPESNLYLCMQILQSLISKEINLMSDRANHIFGSRYKASVISTDQYLNAVIRYLYQNPVRSDMVKNVFDYRFSTIHLYMNELWEKNGLYLDSISAGVSSDDRAKFLKNLCTTLLSQDVSEILRKDLRKGASHRDEKLITKVPGTL